MALADNILALRDATLAELDAVHDYYSDTRGVWGVVLAYVQEGNTVEIRNQTTGNVTSGPDLAGKARRYLAGHLAEATFQQFVMSLESFFFDLLRLWLVAYPQSLGAKDLKFKTVLDAPDKDAVTLHVVNHELNEIAYERLADWFSYLEGRLRLGCPSAEDIERLSEAKASRDVLAHNRGVANRVYLSKAGRFARHSEGE